MKYSQVLLILVFLNVYHTLIQCSWNPLEDRTVFTEEKEQSAASNSNNNNHDKLQLLKFTEKGNVKKVEQLLQKGVTVDAKDYNGNTPLHLAAMNGHINVVRKRCSYNQEK